MGPAEQSPVRDAGQHRTEEPCPTSRLAPKTAPLDKLAPERISNPAWRASFNVAADASPYATYACVDTWLTDFRDDLPKIDVPTLVVHGTEDRILPFEATAARLLRLIKDLTLVTVVAPGAAETEEGSRWHPNKCSTS
jgi:pimeloyl-ACP methyl ester carboxylesterase